MTRTIDEDIEVKVQQKSYFHSIVPSPRMIGKSIILMEKPGGMLILTVGPHWIGVVVTVMLVSVGAYFSFSVISNVTFRNNSLAIIICRIISSLMYVSTISALLMTACSGIYLPDLY